MIQTDEQQLHTCAKCGSQTEEQQAIANEYKCQHCAYELAHLDIAANGAIRGVFGWLKEAKAMIGGRYQVETVLGKGGFGATYLVIDQRVQGKRWALKEIPEILFDEYEVSLLSQLDHPSIPIIVDRFVDTGMVYLVLKFGGTKTLATECKQRKQIAYETLKPWIIQTAEVLTYLHNRTPPIIHRDLKPENILIDDQNRVMLIDFGIAKESVPESVTRTLGRAASHGFSPPEQVMGTGTDVRSDIYSFAATLYFSLVGKTPVAAHERVAGAVLQPPSELVLGISVEINAMLMKALSLNINDRPQTIADFLIPFTSISGTPDASIQSGKTVRISDIQFGPVMNENISHSAPISNQTQIPTPTQQNKHSNLIPIIAGIVALIILISGIAYWLMKETSESPSPDTSTTNKPQSTSDQTAPKALTAEPITANNPQAVPQKLTSTSPSQPQNTNIPSAFDILNKKRANQKNVEGNIVNRSPSTIKPSSERKLIAEKTISRRVTPKKVATVKPTKKPDWGNQPKGNF
jgi:serine/threonine-protein kinase